MYDPETGRVTDFVDANKKRRRQKVGPNRRLAQQVLGEKLKQVTQEKELGIKRIPRMLFSDFADQFLETYSKVEKRSWRRDESILVHLKRFFKDRLLSEITSEDIERYKAYRAAKVKTSTVNREFRCLKTLFAKALDRGKIRENPARKVKLLPKSKHKLVYLEVDKVPRVLACCPPYLRPVVEVDILTGMRRGEILGLRWRDVDFKTGLIYLGETKSGEPRYIPMNQRLRSILRNRPRHISSDFVFCDDRGEPYKDLRLPLQKAVREAGIKKHVVFHTLRHTFASHLVMAGVDL